jgi:hypothetical protein
MTAFLILLCGLSLGGDEHAADPILAEELLEHIEVLASERLEGRGTATEGEHRAANYIVSVLEQLPRVQSAGVEGSWFQGFPILAPPARAALDYDQGRNILALLSGADPELADEYVVFGAHYDHIGEHGTHGTSLGGSGKIHNGADDNASGSAVLLELAAYLATSPDRPRRSVLFQWYSGEELGLLGSRHWVANPTVPLDSVVTMLNFDMVGRLLGSTLLVGGTGTSPGFEELCLQLAPAFDLELRIESVGGAPSDNSSFYDAGIPALFLFTGIHGDYHRPTDDAHLVNAQGTERVARFAELVFRALDAEQERPAFLLAPGMAEYWTPHVYYGVTLENAPEFGGRGRVVVIVPDSPAGRAGLAEGDVFVACDGRPLKTLAETEALLKTVDDARSPRTFEVLRDDDVYSFELRPEVR